MVIISLAKLTMRRDRIRSQPFIDSTTLTLRSRVATKVLSEDLGDRPTRSRTASGSLDNGTYVAGECLESLEVDLGSSISKTNEAVGMSMANV